MVMYSFLFPFPKTTPSPFYKATAFYSEHNYDFLIKHMFCLAKEKVLANQISFHVLPDENAFPLFTSNFVIMNHKSSILLRFVFFSA